MDYSRSKPAQDIKGLCYVRDKCSFGQLLQKGEICHSKTEMILRHIPFYPEGLGVLCSLV